MTNLFRPFEPAVGARFVGRKRALKRVVRALTNPDDPLLFSARPRMGLTSVVREGVRRLGDEAPMIMEVDIATASTPADVAARVLAEAVRAGTKSGPDQAMHLMAGVGDGVRLHEGTPRVGREARALPLDAQQALLGRVIEAVLESSSEHPTGTCLVLDGADRLSMVGGDDALPHLLQVLGRCEGLRVVLASSDPEWSDQATQTGAALSGWGNVFTLSALNHKRLATWMVETMDRAGLRAKPKQAHRIVQRAGGRTGDAVCLAQAVVAPLVRGSRVRRRSVEEAVAGLVRKRASLYRLTWTQLTARQQNLLRALAAGESRPFSEHVRRTYDLRSTAAVARTLELLAQRSLVCRTRVGYGVDDPFLREWIVQTALPDIGPARDGA